MEVPQEVLVVQGMDLVTNLHYQEQTPIHMDMVEMVEEVR
jgi:hypothetical protein